MLLWSVALLPCVVFCSQLSGGIATFLVVYCLCFNLARYSSGLPWHDACVIVACRYDWASECHLAVLRGQIILEHPDNEMEKVS